MEKANTRLPYLVSSSEVEQENMQTKATCYNKQSGRWDDDKYPT